MSSNLLWVTQDFPPDMGGIQTYSAELVRALVGLGVEVDVVAPDRPGAAAHDRCFPARIHRLRVPRDAMPVAAAAYVLATSAKRSFDVAIHAQWTTASGSVLARRAGRIGHVLVAAHGRELLWRPRGFGPAYDRWRRGIVRAADRVLAVSRYTRELVRAQGVAATCACVVPNGTDLARQHRPEVLQRAQTLRESSSIGSAPLIVTVARLVPHKGIDTVIRALPEVVRRVPDVRYVVVGDGRDLDRLRTLAGSLGVANSVHFAGAVSDVEVSAWLHTSDVFALPSRERPPDVEGFGIVLLDAAACGRPVVAGRSGGIADAVVDGVTGLLVDPECTNAVANALIDVLRDRGRATALGAAARARVEHGFTWAHAGRRLHAVLTSLTSGGGDEFAEPSPAVDDAGARSFRDERAIHMHPVCRSRD